MALTRIEVTNFQSLVKVNLDLGVFTVIVGPSSSGKSALMRAFKALASNVRGNGVITRGQKTMAITGRTDTHTVTLERNERSGSYRVTGPEGNLTFTKLAGEVPTQITQALRIAPVAEGGSVNFASQFDKPYLLDESGAAVARVLGELTNVNAIFAAVRSANRIRASAASTLKTRKNDLTQITIRLGAFESLSEHLRLMDEVEKLDANRLIVQERINQLTVALRKVQIAENAIAKAAVPEVPSAEPLNALAGRYLDLQSKLRGYAAKQQRAETEKYEYLAHANDAQHYAETLTDKLREAGMCPTCGQSVA